jgi:hypothetical protein
VAAGGAGAEDPAAGCMAWRRAHEKKGGEEEERTTLHQPSREEKGERAEGKADQGFFTAGYRTVYRGNRSYLWGTVTVPSGRNRSKNSNLNLN